MVVTSHLPASASCGARVVGATPVDIVGSERERSDGVGRSALRTSGTVATPMQVFLLNMPNKPLEVTENRRTWAGFFPRNRDCRVRATV